MRACVECVYTVSVIQTHNQEEAKEGKQTGGMQRKPTREKGNAMSNYKGALKYNKASYSI